MMMSRLRLSPILVFWLIYAQSYNLDRVFLKNAKEYWGKIIYITSTLLCQYIARQRSCIVEVDILGMEETLGSYFKKIREQKSLSIKDVAVRLHVHQRSIRAFEENRLDEFLAHVYARGFFENYGKLLELPVKDFLPHFEELWNEFGGQEEPMKKPAEYSRSSFVTPRRALVLLAVIAMLGIGSYILWHAFSTTRSPSLTLSAPSEDIITHEYRFTMQGSADPRFELTLNQLPVYIDKDGRFEKTIILQKGLNAVILQAKNSLGKATTIERHIIVE